MTSPKRISLVRVKTVYLVIVFIIPAFYLITACSYRKISIGMASQLQQIKIGWNAATDWNGQNFSMHIATVICGNRLEEGLVMLKSVVIFYKSYLVLHVFTEENHRHAVHEEIVSWPYKELVRLKLIIHKIEFPTLPGCKSCTSDAWAKLFLPCAAQRLFIPNLLSDVDSLIYMDADAVILSSIEAMWRQFSKFEPQHIFGVVCELTSWYISRNIPFCDKTGLNSGVMLMNLTRAREAKWIFKIQEYYDKYREELELGDQDLINIFCHFYPDEFYLMQCSWNYRGELCPVDDICREDLNSGINILHANNRGFHDFYFPVLRQIYSAFKEHSLARKSIQDLYSSILNRTRPYRGTDCGKRLHSLVKKIHDITVYNKK